MHLVRVVAANPGDEKENPFGACHCDDELWIAEDCKTGYICDGQESITIFGSG